ncbi:hypothetical protein V6N12_002658 [Hibiscus sabdariffa]|uniref:Exostosin GT47 domain-containing protein n=1 Tax=Hibiscus sabdariffa TaxID=183260 RepID=A0ABR2E9M0_9ROSI
MSVELQKLLLVMVRCSIVWCVEASSLVWYEWWFVNGGASSWMVVMGAMTVCDPWIMGCRGFRFWLKPPGDSYTRRSIFDSILAGCIPVLFHPGTAYAQYIWHLPKNYTKYSVYIAVKDLSEWKINLNETLLRIPEDRISALREEVIKLIPRVVYASSRSRSDTVKDAFDLAVEGILERIEC